MFLIVGLGNPGNEYKNTRHNTGFMATDEIVRRYNFSNAKSAFNAEVMSGEIDGNKVLLMRPQTFMNNSGQAVRACMDFYKIPVENVYVIHDDMDLPVGKLKAKIAGGAGGHNGLKSIDAHCTPNYTRVRIGVGRPNNKDQVVDWVLSNFSSSDKKVLQDLLELVADNLSVLLSKGTGEFTSQIALKNK